MLPQEHYDDVTSDASEGNPGITQTVDLRESTGAAICAYFG